jgi:hypothetical protein
MKPGVTLQRDMGYMAQTEKKKKKDMEFFCDFSIFFCRKKVKR